MGEMADFQKVMNSVSNINNSDSSHGNEVVSNRNVTENTGKEAGIHSNCAKQQSGCDNCHVTMETTIIVNNITETAGTPSGGAICKKKANRPDHLGNVPSITAVGYSNSRSDRKSKDIETWLMDVPVGEADNQQIDCRNNINPHSIDGGPNGPEHTDLQGKTLSQHEKENPEIKSVREGNTESACTSFRSNAASDVHYVRGRTVSRRESRLRKQSCPSFKDRSDSEVGNKEKVYSAYSGQSLMSVIGDSSIGAQKLSGPDKAFSRGLRVDLRRANENGRLVFYFKSPERPRSLSPNYRLTSNGASRMSIGQDSCSEMASRKSSDVASRMSSDVTSRKSSAQSSIFSPSPNEKLRAGVEALRDLYKEHYAVYSGRPWSAGAAR